jgi:site-specific DNA-methyltransferase (adenine-specific)
MHLRRASGQQDYIYPVRNKRDVWTVNTKPDKNAHFAVYPEKLIEPCILAGCPYDGVVLDPFMGSGTTARVAKHFGRKYIGFELNKEYLAIIKRKTIIEEDLFSR